ncbi:MFS transporter [Nocardioides marmoriginsengisoli]|uniref:MFS transporter n=1 Tax=Nocardioides marmoriginsengisoli TaxID=661483 RepID=A0A3N0CPP2_9ACTN|nr:MFS transporter [Nocardioides marmoriginsengisoli]RNL65438.1 MFS transporter [Nocardioides marmoriginsengisoli]
MDAVAAQRRTVSTLVGAQAFGALGITIGIATASLLARDISGSEELAGTAQTAQVLGAAGASWLLARLMAARGRRIGLVVGYLLGAAGSALAVLAGVLESMPVLLFGAVLLGATSSATYASRYAATDLAPPDGRGRALSIVVWATTLGAVAGPNLTGPSADFADWAGIPELTGPFALGTAGMLIAAVVIGVRMRPDPLLLARSIHAGQVADGTQSAEEKQPLRTVLAERPVILAAMIGLAAAHAVMVSVMVMTPLHMEHGGAALKIIGVVISLHVLGMFAFAPVMGFAVDRLGPATVLAAGGVVLLVSLLLCGRAPEGSSTEIFGGLFLLGVGWSMATVSASTMVAGHAPLSSVTEVQGTADLVMNLAAAIGGAASGVIVGEYGFSTLAGFASVFAFAALGAAAYAGLLIRRTGAVA